MNPCLKAALESIDFQRDEALLNELAMHIATLQGASNDAEKLDVLKAMSATAFDKTGMTVNFHLLKERDPNAFIIVSDSNSANPMNPAVVKERLSRRKGPVSEQEFFEGRVDLKTGKVSGIYSKIPFDVFFSHAFLLKTPKGNYFDTKETAAVLTHELGHGQGYLYYLGQSVISNIAVAECAKKINDGVDETTVRQVIKVVEQKTGYKLKDLDVTGNSNDAILIQQIIMAQMVEKIRSDLGTRYYDARAFEYMADRFAARHGGAAYIVKALDRMYREFGFKPIEYRTYLGQFAMSLVYHAQTILTGAIFGAGMGTAGAVAVGIAGALAFTTVASIGMVTIVTLLMGGDIYDDIPNRFLTMRRELIASSKEPALTVAQRTQLVEQIAMIDDVMKDIRENKFGALSIAQFLAGVFTGQAAQLKFMRQLEELTNNRFFELHNQLQAKA